MNKKGRSPVKCLMRMGIVESDEKPKEIIKVVVSDIWHGYAIDNDVIIDGWWLVRRCTDGVGGWWLKDSEGGSKIE